MATSYSALPVKDQVQLMYVAYFGRAGNPDGMNYWIGDITNKGLTIEQVGDSFALQSEAKSKYTYLAYPNLGDPKAFVKAIYSNLFERTPADDDYGLKYWVDRLTGTNTNGTNSNGEHISAGTMIAAIINGAYDSKGPNHAHDVASMENKIRVANYFTQKLIDNHISWDSATMRDDAATCIDNVKWDTDIAATELNTVDPIVNALVAGSGQTFMLTDKLDSFTAVGSGTVNAVISSNSADTTWQVADQISGAAGSTLNLTAVVGTNNSTTGRATSGIENFNITFADNDASNSHTLTVDTSTLTGAKNFTIVSATASSDDSNDSNDKVAFSGLAKSQNVTIKSADEDLGVDLGYKTGEDSGASDVAALAVDGAKVDKVTVNGNFETVKVTGTGTSSVSALNAAGSKMTKLEIAGAGATTLSSVTGFDSAASTLTIDASAATGDVTVGVVLSDKFDIKGGSGSDTIIATNTSGATISPSFKSTGVETILFKEKVGGSSGLAHNINLTNATGVTTVGLRGSDSSTLSDTVSFNNVADNTTVLLQGDKTAAGQTLGNVTVTVKNATASAPANAVTIKVNNQGQDTGMTGSNENTINVGTVTANNVKNITIDAADGDVNGFALAASGLVNLTVKATEDFVFSSSSSGTVGAADKTTTIDASQVAGKAQFTLTGNLEKDVTVTTGAGKDKVTLGNQNQTSSSSDNTITINLGDGDDTFVTGEINNSGSSKTVLKVDLGAGNDTVEVTGGKDINTDKSHSIDFGGGTDTLMFGGSTGSDISTVTLDNLEKVLLTGSKDLSVQAASFSGKSIEITTVDSGRLQLVGTPNADTINASTLNIVGPKGVKIKGGQGDDTITLKADAADTVVFESAASNNGVDTINNFKVGSNGDIFDFKAFLGNSPSGVIINTGTPPNNSTPLDGKVAVLIDIDGNQNITTASGLTAALAVGGEYSNYDMGNNKKAVAITYASGSVTTGYVFYLTSDNSGDITAELVGTVTTDATVANLVSGNFA